LLRFRPYRWKICHFVSFQLNELGLFGEAKELKITLAHLIKRLALPEVNEKAMMAMTGRVQIQRQILSS
jgi:hypothetical protein